MMNLIPPSRLHSHTASACDSQCHTRPSIAIRISRLLICGLIAILVQPALPSLSAQDSTDAPYPPHIVGNSHLRVLPKAPNGRQYQLHIGLPDSYGTDNDRRYPVVYVTDAYWDFEKMMSIRGSLVYDKVAPEFIVVGLGYAGNNLNYGDLRRLELSPVPFGEPAESSGKAAEFLQMIKNEVIPFVEGNYRADPAFRVMSGASLGGLFTLFTMYTEPDLFHGYIAATPAVSVGNEWLLEYENAFSKSGKQLRARLYMTVGGNESPDFMSSILRMNARIASRQQPHLARDFRVIDGERHAGMQFESYVRGLRFVFEPLAPETGPSTFP